MTGDGYESTDRRNLGKGLLLFAAYYASAKGAMLLGAATNFAALLWLPTGIALAALKLWGYRFWPVIFLAGWLIQLGNGVDAVTALGVAGANAGEALVGAWLLNYFRMQPSLKRLRDVLALIVAGPILSTLFSAIVGMLSLDLGGYVNQGDMLRRGFSWWVVDAFSDLIVAPFLLVAGSGGWRTICQMQRRWEISAFVLAMIAICFVVQGDLFPVHEPFRVYQPYLLTPILVWAALRFGQVGTTVTVFAVACIGALAAYLGRGPLLAGSTINNLIYIEMLAAIAAVTMMVLAAAISEQRQALHDQLIGQQQLQQAKDEAEAANHSKSLFLANISHELRTPLGAILGFTDFLLEPHHNHADREHFLHTIKRNGELLARIIDDILDLSKAEANRLDIEMLRLPLADLLSDVTTILGFKAKERGLILRVHSEGDIPTSLTTDPTRLRQILINVIGNAVKFTERGWVDVRLTMRRAGDVEIGPTLPDCSQMPLGDPRQYLEVRVQDTGPGLTPAQAERLFMPFSQADNSMTRRFGGTGLGLFLSHRLAQALGGNLVLAKTAPGEGSLFVLHLPLAPDDCQDLSTYPTAERLLPAPQAAPPTACTPLSNLKVLLVDDSADNQLLIGLILRFGGALVEVADHGCDGIAKAQHGSYDLVLMDIQMPGMDGYAAMSKLRQMGFAKPIIALTAHAMKGERERALHAGFDDYLTKPVVRETMISVITKWAVATRAKSATLSAPTRAYRQPPVLA